MSARQVSKEEASGQEEYVRIPKSDFDLIVHEAQKLRKELEELKSVQEQ